jgi:NAD(P)-dependent dehydrogenase (short-subunit alcohol dehydrogenase family)/acyl dehydratase
MTVKGVEHRIRFSPEDVEVFSAASHDRSPLHLSEEYARRTPYGQPILFGVLTGLACIGRFQPRADRQVSQVTMEFAKPMFAGIDYSLELAQLSAEVTTAKAYDGRDLALKVTVDFQNGNNGSRTVEIPATSLAAQPINSNMLSPGFETRGTYSPTWEHVTAVMNRLGLTGKGLDEWQVASLMWCSQFVGMQLPDSRGLFSRVSLRFKHSDHAGRASLNYGATVMAFDQRFDLLKIGVALTSNGSGVASGEVRAFVRQQPSIPDIARLKRRLPASPNLAGKVALVMGGSRGLGAAIVQLLSLKGCKVLVGYHKSTAAAAALKNSLHGAPGEVSLLQGDAADISWCKEIKQRIVSEEGKLDFLVCTAGPALLPHWLEPHAIDRVNEHVNRSFALVSVPMATFLETLAQNGGWNVVISSSAVRKTVAEWPHYVSAKHAIEGLVKVAAQQYTLVNFLLVRPPRLLTDLTNTPLGREGAIPSEKVATKIVKRLGRPPEGSRLNILSDFR